MDVVSASSRRQSLDVEQRQVHSEQLVMPTAAAGQPLTLNPGSSGCIEIAPATGHAASVEAASLQPTTSTAVTSLSRGLNPAAPVWEPTTAGLLSQRSASTSSIGRVEEFASVIMGREQEPSASVKDAVKQQDTELTDGSTRKEVATRPLLEKTASSSSSITDEAKNSQAAGTAAAARTDEEIRRHIMANLLGGGARRNNSAATSSVPPPTASSAGGTSSSSSAGLVTATPAAGAPAAPATSNATQEVDFAAQPQLHQSGSSEQNAAYFQQHHQAAHVEHQHSLEFQSQQQHYNYQMQQQHFQHLQHQHQQSHQNTLRQQQQDQQQHHHYNSVAGTSTTTSMNVNNANASRPASTANKQQQHCVEDIRKKGAEYETEVHFQKCYNVMAEIWDFFCDMLPEDPGFKFLDLGCAPGGFASFLLEDPRCLAGCGVTLANSSGGYPIRLRQPNFFMQIRDLFDLSTADLLCRGLVHVCICDAQYLRDSTSWDKKYRGIRCRSKQHGVWSLLVKQFSLGFHKLQQNGILIFRFGWKDNPGDVQTIWYKRVSVRLFTLIHLLFAKVKEIKSDYYNILDGSFYVCAAGFDREKYEKINVHGILVDQFFDLTTSRYDEASEHEVLEAADAFRTREVDGKINDMLERVEKLRLVHEQSSQRRHELLQEDESESLQCGKCFGFIKPVPQGLSLSGGGGKGSEVVDKNVGEADAHGEQKPVSCASRGPNNIRTNTNASSTAAMKTGSEQDIFLKARELKELLSTYARVVDVAIVGDCGIVRFSSRKMAESTVAEFNAKKTFGDGVRVWTTTFAISASTSASTTKGAKITSTATVSAAAPAEHQHDAENQVPGRRATASSSESKTSSLDGVDDEGGGRGDDDKKIEDATGMLREADEKEDTSRVETENKEVAKAGFKGLPDEFQTYLQKVEERELALKARETSKGRAPGKGGNRYGEAEHSCSSAGPSRRNSKEDIVAGGSSASGFACAGKSNSFSAAAASEDQTRGKGALVTSFPSSSSSKSKSYGKGSSEQMQQMHLGKHGAKGISGKSTSLLLPSSSGVLSSIAGKDAALTGFGGKGGSKTGKDCSKQGNLLFGVKGSAAAAKGTLVANGKAAGSAASVALASTLGSHPQQQEVPQPAKCINIERSRIRFMDHKKEQKPPDALANKEAESGTKDAPPVVSKSTTSNKEATASSKEQDGAQAGFSTTTEPPAPRDSDAGSDTKSKLVGESLASSGGPLRTKASGTLAAEKSEYGEIREETAEGSVESREQLTRGGGAEAGVKDSTATLDKGSAPADQGSTAVVEHMRTSTLEELRAAGRREVNVVEEKEDAGEVLLVGPDDETVEGGGAENENIESATSSSADQEDRGDGVVTLGVPPTICPGANRDADDVPSSSTAEADPDGDAEEKLRVAGGGGGAAVEASVEPAAAGANGNEINENADEAAGNADASAAGAGDNQSEKLAGQETTVVGHKGGKRKAPTKESFFATNPDGSVTYVARHQEASSCSRGADVAPAATGKGGKIKAPPAPGCTSVGGRPHQAQESAAAAPARPGYTHTLDPDWWNISSSISCAAPAQNQMQQRANTSYYDCTTTIQQYQDLANMYAGASEFGFAMPANYFAPPPAPLPALLNNAKDSSTSAARGTGAQQTAAGDSKLLSHSSRSFSAGSSAGAPVATAPTAYGNGEAPPPRPTTYAEVVAQHRIKYNGGYHYRPPSAERGAGASDCEYVGSCLLAAAITAGSALSEDVAQQVEYMEKQKDILRGNRHVLREIAEFEYDWSELGFASFYDDICGSGRVHRKLWGELYENDHVFCFVNEAKRELQKQKRKKKPLAVCSGAEVEQKEETRGPLATDEAAAAAPSGAALVAVVADEEAEAEAMSPAEVADFTDQKSNGVREPAGGAAAKAPDAGLDENDEKEQAAGPSARSEGAEEGAPTDDQVASAVPEEVKDEQAEAPGLTVESAEEVCEVRGSSSGDEKMVAETTPTLDGAKRVPPRVPTPPPGLEPDLELCGDGDAAGGQDEDDQTPEATGKNPLHLVINRKVDPESYDRFMLRLMKAAPKKTRDAMRHKMHYNQGGYSCYGNSMIGSGSSGAASSKGRNGEQHQLRQSWSSTSLYHDYKNTPYNAGVGGGVAGGHGGAGGKSGGGKVSTGYNLHGGLYNSNGGSAYSAYHGNSSDAYNMQGETGYNEPYGSGAAAGHYAAYHGGAAARGGKNLAGYNGYSYSGGGATHHTASYDNQYAAGSYGGENCWQHPQQRQGQGTEQLDTTQHHGNMMMAWGTGAAHSTGPWGNAWSGPNTSSAGGGAATNPTPADLMNTSHVSGSNTSMSFETMNYSLMNLSTCSWSEHQHLHGGAGGWPEYSNISGTAAGSSSSENKAPHEGQGAPSGEARGNEESTAARPSAEDEAAGAAGVEGFGGILSPAEEVVFEVVDGIVDTVMTEIGARGDDSNTSAKQTIRIPSLDPTMASGEDPDRVWSDIMQTSPTHLRSVKECGETGAMMASTPRPPPPRPLGNSESNVRKYTSIDEYPTSNPGTGTGVLSSVSDDVQNQADDFAEPGAVLLRADSYSCVQAVLSDGQSPSALSLRKKTEDAEQLFARTEPLGRVLEEDAEVEGHNSAEDAAAAAVLSHPQAPLPGGGVGEGTLTADQPGGGRSVALDGTAAASSSQVSSGVPSSLNNFASEWGAPDAFVLEESVGPHQLSLQLKAGGVMKASSRRNKVSLQIDVDATPVPFVTDESDPALVPKSDSPAEERRRASPAADVGEAQVSSSSTSEVKIIDKPEQLLHAAGDLVPADESLVEKASPVDGSSRAGAPPTSTATKELTNEGDAGNHGNVNNDAAPPPPAAEVKLAADCTIQKEHGGRTIVSTETLAPAPSSEALMQKHTSAVGADPTQGAPCASEKSDAGAKSSRASSAEMNEQARKKRAAAAAAKLTSMKARLKGSGFDLQFPVPKKQHLAPPPAPPGATPSTSSSTSMPEIKPKSLHAAKVAEAIAWASDSAAQVREGAGRLGSEEVRSTTPSLSLNTDESQSPCGETKTVSGRSATRFPHSAKIATVVTRQRVEESLLNQSQMSLSMLDHSFASTGCTTSGSSHLSTAAHLHAPFPAPGASSTSTSTSPGDEQERSLHTTATPADGEREREARELQFACLEVCSRLLERPESLFQLITEATGKMDREGGVEHGVHWASLGSLAAATGNGDQVTIEELFNPLDEWEELDEEEDESDAGSEDVEEECGTMPRNSKGGFSGRNSTAVDFASVSAALASGRKTADALRDQERARKKQTKMNTKDAATTTQQLDVVMDIMEHVLSAAGDAPGADEANQKDRDHNNYDLQKQEQVQQVVAEEVRAANTGAAASWIPASKIKPRDTPASAVRVDGATQTKATKLKSRETQTRQSNLHSLPPMAKLEDNAKNFWYRKGVDDFGRAFQEVVQGKLEALQKVRTASQAHGQVNFAAQKILRQAGLGHVLSGPAWGRGGGFYGGAGGFGMAQIHATVQPRAGPMGGGAVGGGGQQYYRGGPPPPAPPRGSPGPTTPSFPHAKNAPSSCQESVPVVERDRNKSILQSPRNSATGPASTAEAMSVVQEPRSANEPEAVPVPRQEPSSRDNENDGDAGDAGTQQVRNEVNISEHDDKVLNDEKGKVGEGREDAGADDQEHGTPLQRDDCGACEQEQEVEHPRAEEQPPTEVEDTRSCSAEHTATDLEDDGAEQSDKRPQQEQTKRESMASASAWHQQYGAHSGGGYNYNGYGSHGGGWGAPPTGAGMMHPMHLNAGGPWGPYPNAGGYSYGGYKGGGWGGGGKGGYNYSFNGGYHHGMGAGGYWPPHSGPHGWGGPQWGQHPSGAYGVGYHDNYGYKYPGGEKGVDAQPPPPPDRPGGSPSSKTSDAAGDALASSNSEVPPPPQEDGAAESARRAGEGEGQTVANLETETETTPDETGNSSRADNGESDHGQRKKLFAGKKENSAAHGERNCSQPNCLVEVEHQKEEQPQPETSRTPQAAKHLRRPEVEVQPSANSFLSFTPRSTTSSSSGSSSHSSGSALGSSSGCSSSVSGSTSSSCSSSSCESSPDLSLSSSPGVLSLSSSPDLSSLSRISDAACSPPYAGRRGGKKASEEGEAEEASEQFVSSRTFDLNRIRSARTPPRITPTSPNLGAVESVDRSGHRPAETTTRVEVLVGEASSINARKHDREVVTETEQHGGLVQPELIELPRQTGRSAQAASLSCAEGGIAAAPPTRTAASSSRSRSTDETKSKDRADPISTKSTIKKQKSKAAKNSWIHQSTNNQDAATPTDASSWAAKPNMLSALFEDTSNSVDHLLDNDVAGGDTDTTSTSVGGVPPSCPPSCKSVTGFATFRRKRTRGLSLGTIDEEQEGASDVDEISAAASENATSTLECYAGALGTGNAHEGEGTKVATRTDSGSSENAAEEELLKDFRPKSLMNSVYKDTVLHRPETKAMRNTRLSMNPNSRSSTSTSKASNPPSAADGGASVELSDNGIVEEGAANADEAGCTDRKNKSQNREQDVSLGQHDNVGLGYYGKGAAGYNQYDFNWGKGVGFDGVAAHQCGTMYYNFDGSSYHGYHGGKDGYYPQFHNKHVGSKFGGYGGMKASGYNMKGGGGFGGAVGYYGHASWGGKRNPKGSASWEADVPPGGPSRRGYGKMEGGPAAGSDENLDDVGDVEEVASAAAGRSSSTDGATPAKLPDIAVPARSSSPPGATGGS